MPGYQGPRRRDRKRHVLHQCFIRWRRTILGIPAGPLVEQCRIRNLTSGGISFRSAVAPRQGWTVRMVFNVPILVHTLPGNFSVAARVMWVDKPKNRRYSRVGCAFKGLSARDAHDLKQFIRDAVIDPHLAKY